MKPYWEERSAWFPRRRGVEHLALLAASATDVEIDETVRAVDDVLSAALRVDPLLDQHQDAMTAFHISDALNRLDAIAIGNELARIFWCAIPRTETIEFTVGADLKSVGWHLGSFWERGGGLALFLISDELDRIRNVAAESLAASEEPSRFTVDELIQTLSRLDSDDMGYRERFAEEVLEASGKGFQALFDTIPIVRQRRLASIRRDLLANSERLQRDAEVYKTQASVDLENATVLKRRAARRDTEAWILGRAGHLAEIRMP